MLNLSERRSTSSGKHETPLPLPIQFVHDVAVDLRWLGESKKS